MANALAAKFFHDYNVEHINDWFTFKSGAASKQLINPAGFPET
jgi:hypothetical protein